MSSSREHLPGYTPPTEGIGISLGARGWGGRFSKTKTFKEKYQA